MCFCSYTEYISNLKPIWLGGIECTDKVVLDGEGRSRTEVVEVRKISTSYNNVKLVH